MTATALADPTDATVYPLLYPCPDWCEGDCDEWANEDGERHHFSGYDTVVVRTRPDSSNKPRRDTKFSLSVNRHDTPTGILPAHVHVGGEGYGFDLDAEMTVEQARTFAEALMRAAALAEQASPPRRRRRSRQAVAA